MSKISNITFAFLPFSPKNDLTKLPSWYLSVYFCWWNHQIHIKKVHSNTKNAKSRICQSHMCYLRTTLPLPLRCWSGKPEVLGLIPVQDIFSKLPPSLFTMAINLKTVGEWYWSCELDMDDSQIWLNHCWHPGWLEHTYYWTNVCEWEWRYSIIGMPCVCYIAVG